MEKGDFQTLTNNDICKLGEQDSGIRTRVEIQNFYELREDCKKRHCLFEDPEFPANSSSLFFSKRATKPYVWKRPQEIVENPQLFVSGATRFDIKQGLLGDCWLLAALANLTLHEDILNFVVPRDQGFNDSYAGIFHFRFWQYGRWVDVVIDDRLPTYKEKLVFLHSAERNEFWSALLEKAYAKLHGSYEALEGGTTSEAMVDLTGGVSEMFDLHAGQRDVYKILLKAYERSSLLSCNILLDAKELEEQTEDGLVIRHAYSITKVKYFHVKTPRREGMMPLIRLRNPWGNDVEWKGSWSDKSKEWKLVTDEEKKNEDLTFDNDGEFWMSFKDFSERFTNIEICSLSPDAMVEGMALRGGQHMWKMSMFEGDWVKNVTAGGCSNNLDTFSCNPQYLVALVDPDEGDTDNKCTLIVALMQKNRRKQRKMGKQTLTIGFEIYHLEDPDNIPKPLNRGFFRKHHPVNISPYIDLREVSCRFRLKPGIYCIVPSTFYAGEEGEFLIRVFTETNHKLMEHDIEVNLIENNHMVPHFRAHELQDVKQFFYQIAGEDMEVSWEKLKEILDFVTKNYPKREEFSKEVCRSMIAMMDVDRSGKLSFEEFKVLWAAIEHWKGVFRIYEKNRSGFMNAGDLKQALSSAGYHLNYRILNVLVHRYGNLKGEIAFSDFIMCAIRLKAMIVAFRKQERENSDIATFSIDQWIEQTLYS
ncbi:calpain-B-like isoform X3 [Periplaneta americana]|uniref:calpain-B-like isoform X3 n=1 Tax=Periplaneta americana TaxID=6978 RepID=UPI0037E7320B